MSKAKALVGNALIDGEEPEDVLKIIDAGTGHRSTKQNMIKSITNSLGIYPPPHPHPRQKKFSKDKLFVDLCPPTGRLPVSLANAND